MSQDDEFSLDRVHWRKSARSNSTNSCVEVASANPRVAVRDSKDPDGPQLTVTARRWDAFAARIKQDNLV